MNAEHIRIAGFAMPLTTAPAPDRGSRRPDKTVTQKSFLGVAVVGDIQQAHRGVAQKPIEDLAPLFQAVLDDPLIAEFGWQQYTPYYNDGEACEFTISTPWFRTTQDDTASDEDDLQVDLEHPTLGLVEGHYQGAYPHVEFVQTGYTGHHEATLLACKALSAAIASGAFDTVLQENFGDHASVTVRRDGIDVETYEHE